MAINPKFNFTLPEEHRKVIEKAAEILGIGISDVVRIGAYRFSKLVIEGKLDEALIDKLKES